MRSENWKKIIALDDERRLIETRISLRAKQHHGVPLTHEEQVLLARPFTVWEDSKRYVDIQNEQWRLMGVFIEKEPNLSIPL